MKDKFDFNKQEDFHRAEVLAYDGTLDCTDFPPPEYKYFSELRKVYQAFRSGELPREQAEQQKKALLMDYRKHLEKSAYYEKVCEQYQFLYETAEDAIEIISMITGNKRLLKQLEVLK